MQMDPQRSRDAGPIADERRPRRSMGRARVCVRDRAVVPVVSYSSVSVCLFVLQPRLVRSQCLKRG